MATSRRCAHRRRSSLPRTFLCCRVRPGNGGAAPHPCRRWAPGRAATRPARTRRLGDTAPAVRRPANRAAVACCGRALPPPGRQRDPLLLAEDHHSALPPAPCLESIFSGVRLRTNGAKRMRVRENALYLVSRLVTRLSLIGVQSTAPTNSSSCSPANASSTASCNVNRTWRVSPRSSIHRLA